MTRPSGLARRYWTALAVVALLTSIPSSARAHTSLLRSDPAGGATLRAPPARVALWFTARPQIAFSRLTLVGPAGEIPLGPLVADTGSAFHADIGAALPPGSYTVRWQTASADGHPIRGEFGFVVLAAGDTALRVASPNGGPPDAATAMQHDHVARADAHETHDEYRTARWIEFVALLTVFGVLGFRHGVLPPLAARDVPTNDAGERARRLGVSALALYAMAAILRVYHESAAVHGAADALDPRQLRVMIMGTVWGIGWLFGVVGAALVALGWSVSRRRASVGTPVALTGALGMAFSPALSGHAASSAHFVLSVVFDVVHVTAAGLWLGALLVVVFAGIPAMRSLQNGNRDAAVSALVNSFHPLALFCAPLVIIAGIGTAWLRLTSPSDLWHTAYGQMLLRKTVFVVFVGAVGAYNALNMRRRLGDSGATRRFRLTATVELLFAAGVLAFTTWLVSMPVPAELVMP